MSETKGKGTMVRVYLMDNTHFWSFSPPTPKKNQKEMVSFVTSKGIEYDYSNWKAIAGHVGWVTIPHDYDFRLVPKPVEGTANYVDGWINAKHPRPPYPRA